MAASVLELVSSAIDELNEQLPPDKRLVNSESTAISGSDGALDSLGFINFTVILEEKVNTAFGTSIALVSLLAESQVPMPRTIGEFVALLSSQLREAAHG